MAASLLELQPGIVRAEAETVPAASPVRRARAVGRVGTAAREHVDRVGNLVQAEVWRALAGQGRRTRRGRGQAGEEKRREREERADQPRKGHLLARPETFSEMFEINLSSLYLRASCSLYRPPSH